MKKYLLTICLLLMFGAAMAQQKKSKVLLVRSERSRGSKLSGKDLIKVYKGTFQQDYSTLTSDSAYFYPQDNAFEAFGNVNINQGDTLNIFSDHLNYNGNTKTAILTDNVKMVDKDATLTTNYFTYNTATRIGTYTGGGKLVNKDNTLTSKNGYYFAFSRDAYFRYNVNLNTIDALIVTDTLRYNSGSRIAYFLGPTNIYGKAKDKDTLYTENGLYNTVTEQAYFGKKNLYKQGTKSLKGDSLFYDRLKGYGRAVKNITFNDREQKITMKGDLGESFKKDERTVVTKNAYLIFVTEDKDTTGTDSTVQKKPPVKKDIQANNSIKDKDVKGLAAKALPGAMAKADSLARDKNTQIVANMIAPGIVTKVDSMRKTVNVKTGKHPRVAQIVLDSLKNAAPQNPATKMALKALPVPGATPGTLPKDIGKLTIPKPTTKKPATTGGKKPGAVKDVSVKSVIKINEKGERVRVDSVYMSADTLETQIMTYKALKELQEKRRLANVRDTVTRVKKKEPIVYKVSPKYIDNFPWYKFPVDTNYLHRDYFGWKKAPKVDSIALKKAALAEQQKNAKIDSIKKLGLVPGKVDSVYLTTKVTLSDTSRIRVIFAYHDAKIYKSDLQAKADSMFYSYADSTIRCFVKPMMWTQGSQLSGDTINLQMKNKKLDNMDIFYNSFIVNVEKEDSVHFNQVGGKKMRGFFRDSKLETMYVDGNAESIYFARDSTTKKVANMQRSLSSRMRIRMRNSKVTNLTFLTKPENRGGPLRKFTEDDKILKGFIWKPKERPASKEDIILSARRKAARQAAAAVEAAGAEAKKPKTKPAENAAKDSASTIAKDKASGISTPKVQLKNVPAKGAAKDSVINVVPTKPDVNRNRVADGTLNTAPVIIPAAIPVKDTATVKPPAGNTPAVKDSTKN